MVRESRTRKNKLAIDFCRCIKKVRKTIKLRPGQAKTSAQKEAAAIAVCVKSVLQTRGKTLKRFRCGDSRKAPFLQTQKLLRGGGVILGNPDTYTNSRQPTPNLLNPLNNTGSSLNKKENNGLLNTIMSVF
jgi:hypothetical protein